MTDTETIEPAAKRTRRMARNCHTAAPGQVEMPSAAGGKKTKTTLILELLRRAKGVSLDELVTATGWLPHTTRAALTGLRKKGHVIGKDKVDGVTRYTVAAPQ